MQYTIEKLRDGNQHVSDWFVKAKAKWDEMLVGFKGSQEEIASLAGELFTSQMSFFERECGGRFIGQEVMSWVGVSYYYNVADGFSDRVLHARAVRDALLASRCSMEVHHHAREAAKSYNLDNY